MINHKQLSIKLQSVLFDQIRNIFGDNILLVNKVSEVLSISSDAAYRRMRGEKKLDIGEVYILCKQFNIALDTFFNFQEHQVSFEYNPFIIQKPDECQHYLKIMLKNLKNIRAQDGSKLLYLVADVPILRLVNNYDLAIFKLFTWANSICNYDKNYSTFLSQINSKYISHYFNEIKQQYVQIPSIEIWNANSFDSILRLITFYHETGYFEDIKIPYQLCNQLKKIVDELEFQVENGKKDDNNSASVNFYISDVALENNYLLITNNNNYLCYIQLFSINGMKTYNPNFCKFTEKWINNIIKKSTLISGSAQKSRYLFFKTIRQKVDQTLKIFE